MDGRGGGSSDLSWCQAPGHLETGADRMELVELCHSLCSLRSHLSGSEVRVVRSGRSLGGIQVQIPSPEL